MGHALIPLLMANVEYIIRTKIPLKLQGRVFSAQNTLKYSSIPIGNLLGGFLSDKLFEAFMHKSGTVQTFFAKMVGHGDGSGIALIYVCLGFIGLVECCLFKENKNLRKLDEE